MYEFWYDYIKRKYGDMVKLSYMDTDSLIMNIKTKDFYKDIAQDVEERFDTSNYNVDRPLPKGKNKKAIGLMKDELGGEIITEFVALRPKTYSYMTDEFIEMKKAKGTKKCVIKKMLKFEDYKKCLFDNEPMLKSQQRFKSENHEVYTENINKIALSSNDDKRIVALDGISSYPYGKIYKIYLYAKDPYEKKYQYLINKREKVGLNHFNDPKAFMEYSNDMQDVYKNIEYYNPIKKI